MRGAASCRFGYFASPTTPTISYGMVVAVERELLSDGTAAAEVVPRHRLIDDRHARPALVLELEIAAGNQRRAERLEVLRADPVQR